MLTALCIDTYTRGCMSAHLHTHVRFDFSIPGHDMHAPGLKKAQAIRDQAISLRPVEKLRGVDCAALAAAWENVSSVYQLGLPQSLTLQS